MTPRVFRGRPLPLGASLVGNSVNFSLLCKHGTAVTLVLEKLDEPGLIAEIPLDPQKHRTGHHWHVRLENPPDQFRFGWCVSGPAGPQHRFSSEIVLLDPAATILSNSSVWGVNPNSQSDRTDRRSVFVRGPRYNWKEDHPPLVPWEDSIVYELHVRGFTCHPSSASQARDLRRPHRKDPLPEMARRHRRRTAADPRVRRDRLPLRRSAHQRTDAQLLGLQQHRLRGAQGRLSPPRPRSMARFDEFRDMVRAFHAGRHRGHPRRRLQPHRRGRRSRPHLFFPRPRQRSLLPARPRRPLPELLRLRQHASTAIIRSSAT